MTPLEELLAALRDVLRTREMAQGIAKDKDASWHVLSAAWADYTSAKDVLAETAVAARMELQNMVESLSPRDLLKQANAMAKHNFLVCWENRFGLRVVTTEEVCPWVGQDTALNSATADLVNLFHMTEVSYAHMAPYKLSPILSGVSGQTVQGRRLEPVGPARTSWQLSKAGT